MGGIFNWITRKCYVFIIISVYLKSGSAYYLSSLSSANIKRIGQYSCLLCDTTKNNKRRLKNVTLFFGTFNINFVIQEAAIL